MYVGRQDMKTFFLCIFIQYITRKIEMIFALCVSETHLLLEKHRSGLFCSIDFFHDPEVSWKQLRFFWHPFVMFWPGSHRRIRRYRSDARQRTLNTCSKESFPGKVLISFDFFPAALVIINILVIPSFSSSQNPSFSRQVSSHLFLLPTETFQPSRLDYNFHPPLFFLLVCIWWENVQEMKVSWGNIAMKEEKMLLDYWCAERFVVVFFSKSMNLS